jgi:putative N-acetylmannosamine-6-phosphate epimerase
MQDIKGLIVSIQRYPKDFTQYLADLCISAGADAIRTDKIITVDKPVIAVQKNNDEYYINTKERDISYSGIISRILAIDGRFGNKKLSQNAKFADMIGLKIIFDVETIKDIENIIKNDYIIYGISTTFSFLKNGKPNNELIKDARTIWQGLLIAEGKYSDHKEIDQAMNNGANAVCIGDAISGIQSLTAKYKNMIKGTT